MSTKIYPCENSTTKLSFKKNNPDSIATLPARELVEIVMVTRMKDYNIMNDSDGYHITRIGSKRGRW
jgi:hypothetical protein